MPYSIRPLPHLNVVEICYTEYMTLEEAESAREEARRILDEHGLRRILVDTRQAQVRLSTMDLYRFGSSLNQVLPFGTRIATLYTEEAFSSEDARFLESVSSIRGIPFRVFTEVDEALAWLSRGSPADGVKANNAQPGGGA